MKKWKCGACGYVHDGDQAPDKCPKCGAAREKFVLLSDEAANLAERSRHTNALHCRLVSVAREVETLCKDGIKDNLDPGCVSVFEKSLQQAYVMMKLAMAEMQTHVGKGKWG